MCCSCLRLCSYMHRCLEMWKSCTSAHLKALRADFLAFLHPGDSWFWLPCGLAHKRCDSTWDARLVLGGFDETWQAWGGWGGGDRVREISYRRGKRLRLEGELIYQCHFPHHKGNPEKTHAGIVAVRTCSSESLCACHCIVFLPLTHSFKPWQSLPRPLQFTHHKLIGLFSNQTAILLWLGI